MVHLAMGCPLLRALSISLCHITDAGLRALAGTLPPTTAAEMLGITLPTGSSGVFQGLSTSTHTGNGRSMQSSRHRPVSETGGGLFTNRSGGVAHRHSSASAYPLTTPNSPSGWLTGSTSALQPKPLVIAGCKELRVLEASQCIQITDAGLAALARNCVNVRTLVRFLLLPMVKKKRCNAFFHANMLKHLDRKIVKF